ncbi:hypothetical protein ACVWZ3_002421 [Bradyrhizobium sp. i1.3.6]
MAIDRIALRRRLGIGDVERRAGNPPLVERLQQRTLIDDPPTRDID